MKEKKLKILNLVDNFFPVWGGVNTVVDSSSKELANYVDVAVCAVKYKNYVDPQRGYIVYRAPGYYNFITHDGMAHPDKKFEKKIADEHFDVLHCHTAGNLLDFALKLGKKYNIPVVSTIHNTYYTEAKGYVKIPVLARLITKILLRRTEKSDYVFAVSQNCRQNAIKFGFKKPIKVLYNAVNLNASMLGDRQKARDEINKKENLSKEDFVVGFVSRIIKAKNIDLVLNLAKALSEHHQEISNIKFLIVGDGADLKYMKKQAKRLNVIDKFIFVGAIRDSKMMGKYYNRFDIVLFPSKMEAAGLIQVEAAAFEKPTLGPVNTAQVENILDGENGLVSDGTLNGYIEKLCFAYNSRERLANIGKRAKETIFRTYKDKKVIDEILQNYNEIIEDFKNKKMNSKMIY